MIDLDSIIIDRSEAQKCKRVDVLREELKGLGYSVVASSWLVALQVQAKRISKEIGNGKAKTSRPHQGKARRAQVVTA